MKKKTPSKRSKRADQKRLSVAEIKADKRIHKNLKQTIAMLEARGEMMALSDLGFLGYGRLKFSAKIRGLSPIAYLMAVIGPRL